jgi:hypothetical protein
MGLDQRAADWLSCNTSRNAVEISNGSVLFAATSCSISKQVRVPTVCLAALLGIATSPASDVNANECQSSNDQRVGHIVEEAVVRDRIGELINLIAVHSSYPRLRPALDASAVSCSRGTASPIRVKCIESFISKIYQP